MSLLCVAASGAEIAVPEKAEPEKAEPAQPEVNAGPAKEKKRSESFASDREYDRHFLNLQRAIDSKEWAIVSQRLLDLQAENSETLVNFQGAISSVPVAAGQLIRALPEEGKGAYLRLAEPVAREKLKAAVRLSDFSGILNVVRCYRHTAAARDALLLVIRRQIDLGELEEAALVAERNLVSQPGEFAARVLSEQKARKQLVHAEERPPEFSLHEFPSQFPVWEYRIDSPPIVQEVLSTTYREIRQSGLAPYPSMSLTQITGGVVMCGSSQRVALDLGTGTPIWQRSIPGYMAKWIQDPGDLSNATRLRMFTISAARRTFDESVTSRTSSDAKRLYFIESILIDDPISKPVTDELAAFPANRVVCVEASSGKTIWEFNGTPPGEIFFAGPPAVYGNRLYVLGEAKSSGLVRLFVLDATSGQSQQMTELVAPWVSLAEEYNRQGQAARIEIEGGQLLCASAAGAIIAVDPLLGEILWAARLPEAEVEATSSQQFDMQLASSGFEEWDRWQDVQIITADEHLLVATPGADVLSVLDRQTGRIIWQCPRGDAYCVAKADSQPVVVLLGKSSARGIDLKSGQLKWESPIPQPAGRGTVTGDQYLFPILEHELARLDLATGRVQFSQTSRAGFPEADGVLPVKVRPRHLIARGGALFELGTTGVRKLQSPQQRLATGPFRSHGEEIQNRIERGNWGTAIHDLQKLLNSTDAQNSTSVKESLRTLLADAYRNATSTSERSRLNGEINQLPLTLPERAAWKQHLAADCLRMHDWSRFVQIWLQCPADELMVALPGGHDDSRSRLDRWFQGEATRFFQQTDQVEQPHLSQILAEQLQSFNSQTPAEYHRIQLCLGETEWGQRWLLQLADEPSDLHELLDRQLKWLRMSQGMNPELAAMATERLMRLYVSRSNWADADRWLKQLKTLPGETKLKDGATASAVIDEFSSVIAAAIADDATLGDWKSAVPQVNIRTGRSNEVYLLPIPVQATAGSMFSRLNVELDFPAHQGIRFNGSSWSRPWHGTLPKTTRNLRHEAGNDRAWGFEQLLVLQSGSEVYGYSPLNFQSKPASRLQWPPKKESIDTLGSRENLMLTFGWVSRKQRPGYETRLGDRVDEFGHFAASVGPVRSEYFCIQQMGMLVAFETVSGKELWRRFDLPRRAIVLGDDRQVVVISPTERLAHRYSALDGRFIGSIPWTRSVDEIIHQQDTRMLLVTGDQTYEIEESVSENSEPVVIPQSPMVLEQFDVATGKQLWKREYPKGSLPFQMDDRCLGVLTQSGHVEILLIDSGKTLHEHQVTLSKPVKRIACSVAHNDFLVVFSHEISELQFNDDVELQIGYRRLLMNGQACCFQRETGAKLWEREIPEGMFRLDQPVDLPVFVMVCKPERVNSPFSSEGPAELPLDVEPGNDPSETNEAELEAEQLRLQAEAMSMRAMGVVLKCFDRRTGQSLAELERERPQYAITGNHANQQVIVNTIKNRLEIDFASGMEKATPIPEDDGAGTPVPTD